MNHDYIAWVDLETTGTSEIDDTILEVGFVLTGPAPMYRVIDERTWVTDELTPQRLWRMNDVVTRMHANSGLLSEAKYGATTELSVIDEELHLTLKNQVGTEHVPLAGSGASHFDRRFIRRYLPKFDKHLSYWAHDVGVLRRALRSAGFPIPTDGKLNHRALDDIRAHIEEMRLYIGALEELRGAQLTHSEDECAQGGYCPAHRLLSLEEAA